MGSSERENGTLIAATVILVLFQLFFGSHIGFGDAHPNLLLIITALWALTKGSRAGVIAGFISGLFYDLLVTTPFGVMTLVLSLVGFFAGLRQENQFQGGALAALGQFALFAIGAEILAGIFVLVMGYETSFFHAVFGRMFASAFLDILFALIVFWLVSKSLSKHSGAKLKGVRYR